jgi:hypothetical protein
MRLPKYDVLMPTLFVALIFPAAAGGWWRYFSGHADQMTNPAVHMQMPVAGTVAKASEPGNTLLAVHRVAYRSAAGASGRRTSVIAERPVRSGHDAAASYISPDRAQACSITQASSGFEGFYLSAEAGE